MAPHSPIAFTISTANHLPRALTLADSMAGHAPEFSFFIVLVDPFTPEMRRLTGDDQRIIPIQELKVAFLGKLMEEYDPPEVCFSLKPVAFRYFFDRFPDALFAVYLDSDVMLYHPFHHIEAFLDTHDSVLTPHLLSPYGFDGKMPDEFSTLRTGYFNMGFAALANRTSTFRLLDWWQTRMIRHGYANPSLGLNADQFWMALAPFYFDGIYTDRNPGMNVAYWNLHERKLTELDGRVLVNDAFPLIFIHFSGFDPKTPRQISHPLFFNRFTTAEQPIFGRLASQYAEQLFEHQFDRLSRIPSPWFSKRKQLAAKRRQSPNLSIRTQYLLVSWMATTPTQIRKWLWRLAIMLVSKTKF